MHEEDRRLSSLPMGSQRADSFAKRVLDEVSHIPGQARSARIDAFVLWLASRVVQPVGYSDETVLDELEKRRMTSDDLILQCVPKTAHLLGQRWTCNEVGFAYVTLGSARLFSLCRSAACNWSDEPPTKMSYEPGLSFVLCTMHDENHTIATSVLAYALRRKGHSVCLLSRTTAEELVEKIDMGDFDCVMFSSSSPHSLATVAAAVKHIRTTACVQPLIAMGGAVVYEIDSHKDEVGADLVSNDINTVLSHVSRTLRSSVFQLRGVAE